MDELKVGVFLGENIPSYWAHSFSVMKMAQGFRNIGCKVEVITAASKPAEKFRNQIKNIYRHYGIRDDIPITYLPPSEKAFESGKTWHDPVFCSNASAYAKKKNFDFIYCRNLLIPILTAKEGISTFAESQSSDLTRPKWKSMYREIMRLNSFKSVVTIHEKIKKKCLHQAGFPEHKVFVHENGVDLSRFHISDDKKFWREKIGLNNDILYAVYCGHLYQEKGIEVILQAAKKLADISRLVFLLVGGRDEEIRKWKAYCHDHSIGNVKFTGFVRNELVPGYLKAADCLLLPYKIKNMTYKIMDIHTTSPLKLFEYMASKRPIVATNIPTIGKLLKHESNSLLTRIDDIEDFCKGITRVLQDKRLGERISNQALQDVQKYTWEERCKGIIRRL